MSVTSFRKDTVYKAPSRKLCSGDASVLALPLDTLGGRAPSNPENPGACMARMLHWPSDLNSKTGHPARDTQVFEGVKKSLGSCQSVCPPLRREAARGLAAGGSRADLQTLLSSTSQPTRPSACVRAALRFRHSTLETQWTTVHLPDRGHAQQSQVMPWLYSGFGTLWFFCFSVYSSSRRSHLAQYLEQRSSSMK